MTRTSNGVAQLMWDKVSSYTLDITLRYKKTGRNTDKDSCQIAEFKTALSLKPSI
jgi:hypothetical protein